MLMVKGFATAPTLFFEARKEFEQMIDWLSKTFGLDAVSKSGIDVRTMGQRAHDVRSTIARSPVLQNLEKRSVSTDHMCLKVEIVWIALIIVA